jgi:hypothetical protein
MPTQRLKKQHKPTVHPTWKQADGTVKPFWKLAVAALPWLLLWPLEVVSLL